MALPTAGNYGRFSYLLGPDGAKVELVTNMAPNAPPITHHHVHFINKQYVEMQQWYMKALNATLRTGPNTFTDFFTGADLPGVGYMLNFFRWEGDQSDHAQADRRPRLRPRGFEVKDLEAFTKELEVEGHQAHEAVSQGSCDEQHADRRDDRSVGRLDRADRRAARHSLIDRCNPGPARRFQI